MPKLRPAGLIAGLLLTACPAGAHAASVTVRVEGAGATLVRETAVVTSSSIVVDKTAEGGGTCAGTSAGGALEVATGGDWGGRHYDGIGQSVERIFAETHTFDSGRYWAFYANNEPAAAGACDFEPQDGDELLFAAACAGADSGCFSGGPLGLRAPGRAAPGAKFTVAVDEYTTTYGGPPDYASSTTKGPSGGATVTGGGVTATTGTDGTAALTLAQRGPVELVATKGGRIRDEATVCVTDGADGFCGTTVPQGAGAQPPAPASAPAPPPCRTTGDDGLCGTRDLRAPQGRITSIAEQARFRRRKAPRELAGTVGADPAGLHAVKLRLTRRHRGDCQYYSGRRERFVHVPCGRSHVFRIGDRQSWSYLLPSRLRRGRYVLDVIATDRAGNRDTLARGRNRVVFYVR